MSSQSVYLRDNKFLISAAARTGSSMLVRLLNSHPDIVCHGELFQVGPRQGFLSGTYELKREQDERFDHAISDLRKRDVKRYLYDIVFESQSASAAGFKFKTTEQFNPDFADIAELVADDKDIKVILLTRRDLLAQYISQRCVSLTGINRAESADDIPEYEPFDVHIKGCLEYIETVVTRENKSAQIFRDHRTISVSYEELVGDRRNCISRLQSFIGVKDAAVETKLVKLVKDSYGLVRNLDETVKALIDNGYGDRMSQMSG